MDNNFLNLGIEDVSYCLKCGKKIKLGYYYLNRGPYGICCYKKLFGIIGITNKRKRNSIFRKKNIKEEGDICPVTGIIKDCEQCLFFDDCKYKWDFMNKNDLEEIIVLNLKINSLILTTLVSMESYNISKVNVINLLKDVKKVLTKINNKENDEQKIINCRYFFVMSDFNFIW